MSRFLIVLVSCLVSGSTFAIELEFYEEDLSFSTRSGYDVIRLNGCDFLEGVGKPLLPVRHLQIAIPSGTTPESIRLSYEEMVEIEGNYRIHPCQPPLSTSSGPGTFVEPDPSIYGSPDPFPTEVCKLGSHGYLGGHHIVSVEVFPVRYVPSARKLFLLTRIDFDILLSTCRNPDRILKRTSHSEHLYRSLVQEVVVNPHEVTEKVARDVLDLSSSPEVTEYLIITDSACAPAFEELALWKTQKGVPAEVVTTSWIYTNYAGVDSQEMIRNCINDYRATKGTVWVLLGGDATVVPHRKCYAAVATSPPTADSTIPCDLYYSELDADWDSNGNGVYGEVTDIGGNLYPDVWVGRAPVESEEEACVLVGKILTYEVGPPADYALEMLFLAEYIDDSTDFALLKDTIDALAVPPGFDPITKFYERDGNLYKSTTIDAMNTGYNLINHAGHGVASGMKIGSDYLMDSDMYGLTNSPEYSILYSLGCQCGAFDGDCVLEDFVLAPDGGGFSIGNSRLGWYSSGDPGSGSSDKYEKRFWTELFQQNIHRIGIAHGQAKVYYIGAASHNGSMRWCHFSLNLLGDPEMPVWTDTPDTMEVSHSRWIPPGASDFIVNVSDTEPMAGALVCLMRDSDIYQRDFTDVNGAATFSLEVYTDDTISVTVTKENYKPYLGFTRVVTEPMASFSAIPASGQAPLEVPFSNESEGLITGYQWDFGDEEGSEEPDPIHTYSRGAFDVTLAVTGPYGADTLTKHDYIKVWDDSVWVTGETSGPIEKVSLDVFLKWSGGPYATDSVSHVDIPLRYDTAMVRVDTLIVGDDFSGWMCDLSWSNLNGEMRISLQNPSQDLKPEGVYQAAEIALQVRNVTPPDTAYIDTTTCGQPPEHLCIVDQLSSCVRPNFSKGSIVVSGFPCGDCNGDDRVTVADATYIISYIYRGGAHPKGWGDVNNDGSLTVADAIYLGNFLYRGGEPPCAGF